MEARAKVNCSCGCGFKYYDVEVAKAHCERTGHVVSVNGLILPIPQTPAEVQKLRHPGKH